MKRQPSLHINEDALSSILADLLSENKVNLSQAKISKLVVDLLTRGRNFSLTHRAAVVTNEKLKRDTNKVNSTGISSAVLFGRYLIAIRQKQFKHRGISLPKVGTPEWLDLKTAAGLATSFCNEYGIELRAGYQRYITIGLTKMKNFSIFKFKQLHAGICKEYEAIEKIEGDKNKELTKLAHQTYVDLVAERVGWSNGFEQHLEKYACFVEASQEAINIGVDVQDYIKAQFHGFDWLNTVPDPYQLTGTKALDRLQKYCYEMGIKLHAKKERKVNFKKLKD